MAPHLENRIAQMAIARGCKTVDEFIERTGIARSTGYELWSNSDRYPSPRNTLIICEIFECQPGEFLAYTKKTEN